MMYETWDAHGVARWAKLSRAALLNPANPGARTSTRVALSRNMIESSMLWRVRRETTAHHATADRDRLSVLSDAADISGYAAYLARVYGFEAPIESALANTRWVDALIDFGGRNQIGLLRSDLHALGVEHRGLPRCATGFPFPHPAEALGWMYVIERNTLLHFAIGRQLRWRVPSRYFATEPHTTGTRLRALGAAMERVCAVENVSDRIIAAAKIAFELQRDWYAAVAVPRRRVA